MSNAPKIVLDLVELFNQNIETYDRLGYRTRDAVSMGFTALRSYGCRDRVHPCPKDLSLSVDVRITPLGSRYQGDLNPGWMK